ncbi:hypothetical protein POJ06DRAFT_67929 [Lipomyces tetrasporus]|uniref:Uncharacterized protein n=1 Tax=Lipomyces tetrasporus TaxID=54092 RepID=A0AAD7VVC8_9ASCO|nr:uncharacterized protein POJ06DRAFT_67929 [Lipomyces tetrasporus]KAJ8103373.1 hypothetical protein POJ06DRAFT_67929 [Lipomyces tetrasporus]
MGLTRTLVYSGSLLGLSGLCIYQYTSPIRQDPPRPVAQLVAKQIEFFNTNRNPVDWTCLSMRCSKSVFTAKPLPTAKSVMLAMFNSWIMAPERNFLRLFISSYAPATAKVGESSFGLFDTVYSDGDDVILHWQMRNKLEGLHVIRAIDQGEDVVFQFDTAFWNPVSQVPPANAFTLYIHTVYAKMLLRAAVAAL